MTTTGAAPDPKRVLLTALVSRYVDTPIDTLPDPRADQRRRGLKLTGVGAALLGVAIAVLASTSSDAVALLGFLFLIAGTGCLTLGVVMRIAKGVPSRAELAAAIEEQRTGAASAGTPVGLPVGIPVPPPVPSLGKGLALLAGGAAVVGLNVTFLGPSAVYFCFWITGGALIAGGIGEIAGSVKKSR